MEEKMEQPRAIIRASSSTNLHNTSNKLSQSTQHRDFTSSDDDQLPACCGAPTSSVSVPPSSFSQIASTKAYIQGSISFPAGSADMQSRIPAHKGVYKKPVTVKSRNRKWHRASGAGNNLVISFSDNDDSGSDSEKQRQEISPRVNKNSPALPRPKMASAKRVMRNGGIGVPKRASLSRTFVSPMTNRSHSRHVGSSLSGRKRSNSVDRNLETQDLARSGSVELKNSKLQDLRQQIAMRENELKLKAVQQNKESLSDSGKDSNGMYQKNALSMKNRAQSVDLQFEPKEPSMKRLKITQNSKGEQSLGEHDEKSSLNSTLVLNGPVLEQHDLQKGSIIGHSLHDSEVSQSEMLPCNAGNQVQDVGEFPFSSEHQQTMLRDGPQTAVSHSLPNWLSIPRETLAVSNHSVPLDNAKLTSALDKPSIEKKRYPIKVNENQPSSSSPNQETLEDDISKRKDHQYAVAERKSLKYTSASNLQATPDNTGLLNCWRKPAVPDGDDVELQSLFDMEELNDKELEEAQEHRRRCEIEERNALKAYRKAQRDLAEANARCSFLYRKRELYSAQLRSLVMGDSSLLWPSALHRQIEERWNTSNNASEVNPDLINSSGQQLLSEFEAGNQLGYDSNVQSASGNAQKRVSPNAGRNLGSEASSEPDASSSEMLPCRGNSAANGIYPPSNDENASPDDEEETFPFDQRFAQANVEHIRKDNHMKESGKEKDGGTSVISADGSQDPLLLEAYLRSKLVERLGSIATSKRSDISDNRIAATERAATKAETVTCNIPISDPKVSFPEFGGPQAIGGSIFKPSSDFETEQHVEEHFLNASPEFSIDEDNRFDLTQINRPTSTCLSSSIFKSVLCQIKTVSVVNSDDSLITNQHDGSYETCSYKDLFIIPRERRSSIERMNSSQEGVRNAMTGGIGSYTCNYAVDPLWPLCMYELRGRCNNEECPWQHAKDYASQILNQRDSSDTNADYQVGASSSSQKRNGGNKFPWVITPPAYIISLDNLKAEQCSYGSLPAREVRLSWRRTFSASLVVSSSLQKHLPSDEPILHGNDGYVETHGNCNQQSLYFQSRNGTGNLFQNGLADVDQLMEMALIVLNQEVDKVEGLKKALSALARAIEVDPSSVNCWIVYLLVYYSDKNSIGEDDLYSYAVKHNKGSYDLWLMYINSRGHLNDRFAAYETALSSLCHHASASDRDGVYASACILDVFLQMLYCSSMTGNVEKAIQRIYGLIHAEKNYDESNYSLLLSDILSCLTISDECIFWVCCLYLVIYRKLPNALVQQFELEKEISLIEWPSVDIPVQEKQKVYMLMEMAEHSVKSHSDSKSRSAYLFALSHIRLMEAVDGVESSKNLLEKYTGLYPSCLDLTLLSARVQSNESDSLSFRAFEEALRNWPKNFPGIQCIWNQYVEYVLQNGRFESAKEIMGQWFDSVGKAQFSENKYLNSAVSVNKLSSGPNDVDLMFGFCNISLHWLLQGDLTKAWLAIDRALDVGSPELLHCVREHAMFLLKYRSQLMKDVPNGGLTEILNAYLIRVRDFLTPVPLTRKFIHHMQKPRLRQLVSNILSPLSPDFSMVNIILETWFGPSLLPQHFDKLKYMVDFVEAVLDVSPSNYPLTISLSMLLTRGSDVRNDISSAANAASVSFWASSVLVNTVYQTIPVPPEHVWLETAALVDKLTGIQEISESFHRKALTVYPFSVNLWKSYHIVSLGTGNEKRIIDAARERGIELGNGKGSRDESAEVPILQ